MMASSAETCCLFYPLLYVVYDFETCVSKHSSVRRFLPNSHIYFLSADLALGVTEIRNTYLVFCHPLVIAQGGFVYIVVCLWRWE